MCAGFEERYGLLEGRIRENDWYPPGPPSALVARGLVTAAVRRSLRMDRISRRQVARGAAAAAAAITLGSPSVHAQKDRQTLRFVAQADLKILDPVWTTAYITRNHSYLVYDTLFGTDENFRIKPQMVGRTTVSADGMKYTFTLRDGLRWHDGHPVVSEDCVESIKRWGKTNRFGQLLMASTGRIAPVDNKTFTLELAQPFGPVLDALGGQRPPFMMPARIASTPAEEQVKEIVGSGPFKFAKDEWQPGEQVAYVSNPDYIPRDEPPSGSTGGKKVYIDKVVWRYLADPWEAANELTAGEVDWWEQPPLDFIPKIEQNPDLQTFLTDPQGTQGWLRPNCLHPPFNNKKARQALLHMMDQVTYLALAIGQSQYYRPCYSVFPCGSPYTTRIGAEPMMEHDLTKAKQLVKESGYDGQSVVVLHITDIPFLNAAAIVTRQRLESIGFKVILKAMDWSTSLIARARKDPPDKGGWNLLHTWFQSADVLNPAVHFGVSGAGANAWFGWPDVPQLDKLVTDWVRASDQTKRLQLGDEIQKIALSEVTYVPWGEWVQPTAFRKTVRNVLKFGSPIFWNVKMT
jgi:peptide/nickel transport system substrate-binding protein